MHRIILLLLLLLAILNDINASDYTSSERSAFSSDSENSTSLNQELSDSLRSLTVVGDERTNNDLAETKDVDNRSESDLPGTTDHIPSLKITISDYSADSGREEASASESSDEKALSCPSKRKAHANIPPTKKIIRLDFSNISPVSPRALQISKTSTVDRKGLQKLAVEKAIRGGRRQGRRKYTEPEIPKIELSESNRFLEARSAMSKWASSPSILNAGDLEWAADSNNDPNALGDTISRFIMESNEEIKPPPLLINRRSGLEGSSESLPLKEPSFSDSKPLSPLRLSQRGGLLRGRSHGSQLLPVITETIYDTYNEILDLKKPENNNFVPVIKDFSQKYFAKFTENFTKAIFRPILKSHKSIVKVVEPLKLLISMIRNDDELLQNFFLSTYHIYMDDETMFKLVSSIIHFIRENFPHANTWPKIFLTFIVEWIGTYCTSHDAILEMFAEMKEILNEPSISGAIRKGSKDYEDLVEQIALRERHPFKSINFPKNMAELHQSIFSIGSLELALSLHTYMINVIWCSVKKGDPTDLIVKSLQPSNSGSEESVFLNINTFSKSLAGWIAKVILNEVSPDRRAVILEYFINTAWNALTEFNNFELVFAIILGIRAAEKQCLENSSSFFNDELSDGSTEQFMDFRRFQFPDTKQRYEKLNWLVRKDHYFVNYRRTFVKCQEGVIPFFGIVAATMDSIRTSKMIMTIKDNLVINFELLESAYAHILILRQIQLKYPYEDNLELLETNPLMPYFSEIHHNFEMGQAAWFNDVLSEKLNLFHIK